MTQHHFHLQATWNGGRLGDGTISAGNLQAPISIPQVMGGPGIGTNPDEMLVGAAATCYLITLAAMLENRRLPLHELTLSSEGIVSQAGSLKFEKIIHRPRVILASEATEQQITTAETACHRADQHCMISKALHGNVEIIIEPTVIRAE